MEGEDEGEGETKCNGTKQMGQNEWDEVNVGRNDRVPFYLIKIIISDFFINALDKLDE